MASADHYWGGDSFRLVATVYGNCPRGSTIEFIGLWQGSMCETKGCIRICYQLAQCDFSFTALGATSQATYPSQHNRNTWLIGFR